MLITEYRTCDDIDIIFPEYNYSIKHVDYSNFKKGTIRCPYEPTVYGHGYIGVGPYKVSEKGKLTKIYRTWNGMLERCYSKKLHDKYPTYINCTVCNEWLNFQNFAEWYNNNYYEIENNKMNLDKDILIKGNKVYSPDTCVFVPQNINKLFIKRDSSRGEFPIGVHYYKRNKKFGVVCSFGNSSSSAYLGLYDTPEEAFQVYKTFKENQIKQIANEYIDIIPTKLYQAMIEYEVEYDD